MRFSLFLAACAAFTLSLSGCADTQPAHIVTQKHSTSQSPTSAPPAAAHATAPNAVVSSTPLPAPMATSLPLIGKARAAILLPLSGKNAALGQAMLNAAQQAVFDAAGDNFELLPRDTAVEGGAREAARGAIIDGAQLIIGPLFGANVPEVKAEAQKNGLLMLPLSTDTSLAERGVYVMGLAPGAQVERVVAYAAAHGAKSFAALIPTSPYGALVGQVFRAAVARNGASLVAYETYDPATAGDEAIRNLALQENHIDALFLPESGDDLKAIADKLTLAGFDPAHTHILGTGLWDVPGLGHQSTLLNGGWYAAPDPAARRAFIAAYTASYGQEPPRLATLAYDATALAAIIAKHGARYDEATLTNPNGFAGLDGIFRLKTSGIVERAMAIDEVTPDSARVIDPAPVSFVR